MKEIKEAYENLSKPETRATYDSQSQPVKPTNPVAPEKLSKPATLATSDSQLQPVKPPTPATPSKPKREDVVVEQKPVSPPDKNKSLVTPYQPPPLMRKHCLSCNAIIHRQTELCPHCGVRQSVLPPNRDKSQISPIDVDRHIKKIELADRGTRLKAFIYDSFIMSAPSIFIWLFFLVQALDVVFLRDVNVLLRGAELSLIGIIMTNLVLLYRYGQTLGKRIVSVKIVNADGSRARLGTLLVRTLVTFGIPLFVVILLTEGLAYLSISYSSGRSGELERLLVQTLMRLPFFQEILFMEGRGMQMELPVIYGALIALSGLLLIFQKSRRCLHDIIAKTIVVKVSSSKATAPALLIEPADTGNVATKIFLSPYSNLVINLVASVVLGMIYFLFFSKMPLGLFFVKIIVSLVAS